MGVLQGLAVGRVADIIKVAGKPTVERVAALEEENRWEALPLVQNINFGFVQYFRVDHQGAKI